MLYTESTHSYHWAGQGVNAKVCYIQSLLTLTTEQDKGWMQKCAIYRAYSLLPLNRTRGECKRVLYTEYTHSYHWTGQEVNVKVCYIQSLPILTTEQDKGWMQKCAIYRAYPLLPLNRTKGECKSVLYNLSAFLFNVIPWGCQYRLLSLSDNYRYPLPDIFDHVFWYTITIELSVH